MESGVDLIREMKRLKPFTEIILRTAHGNIPDGVQLSKMMLLTISPKEITTIRLFL